jgi:hypothetical protein
MESERKAQQKSLTKLREEAAWSTAKELVLGRGEHHFD